MLRHSSGTLNEYIMCNSGPVMLSVLHYMKKDVPPLFAPLVTGPGTKHGEWKQL